MIKKTILMLLVMIGGVIQANAVNFNVYFKPSYNWTGNGVWYALYMYNSSGNTWAKFDQEGSTGIWKAEYDSGYTTFIICKMKSGTSVMSWDNRDWQSGDISAPNSHVFYDKSKNNWEQAWTGDTENMVVKYPSDYGDTNYPCIVVANSEIVNNNESWNTTSTVNKMTYQDDFTYSLDVTEHFILGSTSARGFKIFRADLPEGDSQWCGDPENSGANFPVTISTNGYYTINYTYNILTGKAVGTPTKTKDVTMKYSIIEGSFNTSTNEYVFNDNRGEMTYDADNNRYALTISNKALSNVAPGMLFKVYRQVFVGNVAQGADDYWISGLNAAYNYGIDYTPSKNSVYNVTIYVNASNESTSVSAEEQFTGYYIVGGTENDPWTIDATPMTEDNGVYKKTFTSGNYSFAITPNTNINSSNGINNEDWVNVIRPTSTDNVRTNLDYSCAGGTSTNDSQRGWFIPSNYSQIEITYDPTNNTWSAANATFTRTLPSQGQGYGTFSSVYDVIPDANLTSVQYASAINKGVITWSNYPSTGIKANQGALLYGTANTPYTFTPASAAVAPGTNFLKPNLTYGKIAQSTAENTTNYILTNVNDNVGFYKVNSSGNNVAAGAAYLQVNNGDITSAPYFSLDGEGGTTGIQNVNVNTNENQYYTLDGRRVAQPTKGLYIVNGKKVIIK